MNGSPINYYYEFVDKTAAGPNQYHLRPELLGVADTLDMQVTTNDEGMFGFQNIRYFELFEHEIIKYTFFPVYPGRDQARNRYL